MKQLGVKWIISVSAVGSLQEHIRPCDIVFIDQFVDKTKQHCQHSFFGEGIVAHIAFADPICPGLRQLLIQAAQSHDVAHHDRGTYVNMEGPAFSTRAESVINHQAGLSVIGMTNLAEAKCAREAEISYATMAMVTDYDAWNPDHDHVTVEQVIDNLHRNADTAKNFCCMSCLKYLKKAVGLHRIASNTPSLPSARRGLRPPSRSWVPSSTDISDSVPAMS